MLYSDTCIQTLPSSAIRINLMLVKVPWASQVVLDVKNLSANAGGWGRTHGGRNGNLLQYSCLEHPMDRGAWWARIHGVTKSQTRLKRLSSHTYLINRKRENGTRCHVSIHILLLIYTIKLARRKAIKCGNNHSSMIRSPNQTSIKGNRELVQNNDCKYQNVNQ